MKSGAHLDRNICKVKNDSIDSNGLRAEVYCGGHYDSNLDDWIKARLRMRAASHDRSMGEEARVILREALQDADGERGLGTLIHKRFMAAVGVEYPLPERKQRARKPDKLE